MTESPGGAPGAPGDTGDVRVDIGGTGDERDRWMSDGIASLRWRDGRERGQ